jgi:superfamily II DNA or RNA helicase
MTRLRDFDFAPSYEKSEDDIAELFYLPCMRSATEYDRISGYFSSAVFSIAWPALKEFVKAGGHMRIICSPVFSSGDLESLRIGHQAANDSAVSDALVAELSLLLSADRSRKPTRVLAGLVAAGVVEMRVAVLSEQADPSYRRMFHDKVGLFTDRSRDSVGFRGSMNETYLGLAADGNLESIDVFPSWAEGRDAERAAVARSRFDLLWENMVSGVDVYAFPEAVSTVIHEAGSADWEVLVDEVVAEAAVRRTMPHTDKPLRDHQVQALAAWNLHGRRGLLEHATGSGKTYTAINAIRQVVEEGNGAGNVLVLVPSSLLLAQWRRELRDTLADLEPHILLAGDGNDEWRHDSLLRVWTNPTTSGLRIVLATIATAATDGFLQQIMSSRLLLIADEAHRLGSPGARVLLTMDAPWRLGLSATPKRAGDTEGTEAVLSYFGGILQPPYLLTDAIRDRVLTPYNYYPYEVQLTDSEQAEYDELSRRIRRELVRSHKALDELEGNERLRRLAIARARLLKGAAGKVALAQQIVSRHYRANERWLVYCDSLRQLRLVRDALTHDGINSLEYHTQMHGDPTATLAELELNGGILVSIRCLDEGVDLPAVSHALILASSRNPREFIQRRGRILRRYPGKSFAFLHDAVTTPAPDSGGGVSINRDRLLAGELGRVLDFARGAANPQSLTSVEALCIRHGIPLELDTVADQAAGIEIEEEEAVG